MIKDKFYALYVLDGEKTLIKREGYVETVEGIKVGYWKNPDTKCYEATAADYGLLIVRGIKGIKTCQKKIREMIPHIQKCLAENTQDKADFDALLNKERAKGYMWVHGKSQT